jgi:hypothetical protein
VRKILRLGGGAIATLGFVGGMGVLVVFSDGVMRVSTTGFSAIGGGGGVMRVSTTGFSAIGGGGVMRVSIAGFSAIGGGGVMRSSTTGLFIDTSVVEASVSSGICVEGVGVTSGMGRDGKDLLIGFSVWDVPGFRLL